MTSTLDLSFAPQPTKPAFPMLAFAFASGDDKKPPILSESAIQADAACGGAITQAIKDTEFKASAGSSLTVRCADGAVVIIGAGKAFTPGKEAEDIGGHITAALAKNSLIKATLMIDSDDAAIISGIGLGAVLAAYKFSHYFTKGDKAKPKQRKLTITSPLGRKALTAFKAEKELAEGVFLARDLVYEPANMLYPESFAKRCKMLENECGLKVEVLDEKAMKKEGMDLLLSVGQGSTKKSQMVIMRWDGGKKGEKPLALIGKGVCFDTGGISIKPAGGMEDMKWDMGGAAAVTGAMRSIAGRKLKRNVIGLIGLVENMPDGNATRPGDVVKSMSGQTVEIINTDAEGRLVLADVLTYTLRHFEPEKMVNLATLTGAIIVSLGKEHAGLFSNDDDLSGAITACLLYTSPSPRDPSISRMPSSA